MSTNETPRTDAFEADLEKHPKRTLEIVEISAGVFARQLERELNEAKDELRRIVLFMGPFEDRLNIPGFATFNKARAILSKV